MITQRRVLGGLGLAVTLSLLTISTNLSASADTETCVGHTEFDNTEQGLTPTQVANRYDVYGVLLDDTAETFRRGYRSCWAPGERRAVVVYSYDTGTSVDWYIRDV